MDPAGADGTGEGQVDRPLGRAVGQDHRGAEGGQGVAAREARARGVRTAPGRPRPGRPGRAGSGASPRLSAAFTAERGRIPPRPAAGGPDAGRGPGAGPSPRRPRPTRRRSRRGWRARRPRCRAPGGPGGGRTAGPPLGRSASTAAPGGRRRGRAGAGPGRRAARCPGPAVRRPPGQALAADRRAQVLEVAELAERSGPGRKSSRSHARSMACQTARVRWRWPFSDCSVGTAVMVTGSRRCSRRTSTGGRPSRRSHKQGVDVDPRQRVPARSAPKGPGRSCSR